MLNSPGVLTVPAKDLKRLSLENEYLWFVFEKFIASCVTRRYSFSRGYIGLSIMRIRRFFWSKFLKSTYILIYLKIEDKKIQ